MAPLCSSWSKLMEETTNDPRVSVYLEEIDKHDKISFYLPTRTKTAGAVLKHAIHVMETIHDCHSPMIFKVGFTSDPELRWENPKYGYKWENHKWERMVIIYVSKEPWSAAMLEAALIDRYMGTLAALWWGGAPCSSAIRAAQAVVEEVPAAANTTIGVLAQCSTKHSESSVHKIAKDYKLTLPIPLTPVEISKDDQIPVCLLSSWLQFILSLNLWHLLSGLPEPDDLRCKAQWTSFWRKFKKIMPNHDVFHLAQQGVLSLDRTAAMMLHGDEGRSKKKRAIMILNAFSVLGFGSNVPNRRASLETDYDKQDINFKGNTWVSRWLLGVLPKSLYDPKKGHSNAYDRLSQALADDMNQIISNGFMSLTKEKHWIVVLYVTGDWPYHQKTFHLGRTFGSVAKQPSSKAASKGICHNCLADQEGYPFEDFESPNPRWRSSIGRVSPFLQDPIFLQLPHDRSSPTSMIGLDVFHGFHLGAGKVFCSSCLVLLAELFPGTSVDIRFENMQDAFFQWCRLKKQRPYISKLTKETVKWIQSTDFPGGAWSKGSTTLCLLRFIIDMCKEREQDIQESLLHIGYLAAVEVNHFFSKIYKEGVWIPGGKAQEVANHGLIKEEVVKYNSKIPSGYDPQLKVGDTWEISSLRRVLRTEPRWREIVNFPGEDAATMERKRLRKAFAVWRRKLLWVLIGDSSMPSKHRLCVVGWNVLLFLISWWLFSFQTFELLQACRCTVTPS
eukprot:Skav220607  [mRNA]  locus=scaffold507:143470:153073:+ [translate_table: standard]